MVATETSEQPGGHQREGRAEQHRLWEDQQRRDHPLHHHEQRSTGERREDRVVGERTHHAECIVKDESEQPDHELDDRVPEQRLSEPRRALGRDRCTKRHTAQEDHEHDHLRVRAVTDEESEVAAPDGLIDESGRAREDEDQRQEKCHGSESSASPSGRAPRNMTRSMR